MAKLTMEDVGKRLDEIRARTARTQRPNSIQSLLDRARNRVLPPKPSLRRPR